MSEDFIEETKFETLHYTNPREYCVITKTPFWNILKTVQTLCTWRTWTSKQNSWPPFVPIRPTRQQMIKGDHDSDFKWFLWRTLWVSAFRNNSLALALHTASTHHVLNLAWLCVNFLKRVRLRSKSYKILSTTCRHCSNACLHSLCGEFNINNISILSYFKNGFRPPISR